MYKKNNYSSQLRENSLAKIEIHAFIIETLFAEIEIHSLQKLKFTLQSTLAEKSN